MMSLRKTLTAAAVVLGLAAGSAQAADPTKIGFVYVGPIGDHGWSYQHDQGRLAVEKAFGDKVKTTYVEKVPEGADAQRVINQLASTGHDLIFTTSFGFMNPTLKVAKRFPKVKFEHATGFKRSNNVATYSSRFYEGRYVVGHIAGKMTKSNVLGYVASFPIPEVVRGINATILGARQVNPDVTIKVIWVNSWFDPGKEADAARALIDQGVDVILQHTDSPAPVQVAEERGVWAVGQASDMKRFGEKVHLTAIVDDWAPYYVQQTKALMDGTWKSMDTWGGLNTGMVKLTEYNPAIPADVVALAEKIRMGIEDGSVHPFAGPIKGQDGKIVVKDGETLDDGALAGMKFYVEGVQGKLPQ
ncbi:BMP family ABC transporter substrate-binding protein [Magnetospira sp. QH-2]|uniref:BMP family ABC transporter substrate-binding protein n=1 Tax=Magnetospira sp. (strain QH-2) TaxID=1288970 RepID=UPI0003E8177E|nr:BMP family ABC transporter substrate-binding protein [Magnetospira sp. QH-2]CCQ74705.1 putative basic membrane lipoprotein [Magnetospira sp. QH-2]